MKILKTLLIALAAIVVLAIVAIAFLPSEKTVERSIVVSTAAAKPFKLVNHLPHWTKWSPWYLADTTQTMTFSEVPEGANAWYTWDSKDKQLQSGKMTIVSSAMPDSIIVELSFTNSDWEPARAGYYFESVSENETKVTQRMHLKANGFFEKGMIALMAGQLGKQFEDGLVNIKKLAESMPDEPEKNYRIEGPAQEDMASVIYLGITDSTNMAGMQETMSKAWGEIMVQAGIQGLEQAGAPFVIYEAWEPANDLVVMRTCMPMNKAGKSEGRVMAYTSEAGKAVCLTLYGPYEALESAHMAIDTYLKENGLQSAGAPWEIYQNDPTTVTDPMEIQTKVCYPVN